MTLPDSPQLTDYPAAVGVVLGVLLTAVLLFVSGRFDPTNGVLTLSILVVVAFVGIVMFSLLFPIPAERDERGLVGGMTAAFGAIVAYWLGRRKGNSWT